MSSYSFKFVLLSFGCHNRQALSNTIRQSAREALDRPGDGFREGLPDPAVADIA
ncbi:hypothetical protein CH063_00347 [Colletotrichum higginsianum]|uniref:Uncharacterized protein n=1 Tax=Colletotrichum higginsianum (strain IMI 349063) TaxID=759273 RepID=H1VIU7_COLHI|nr:hypothetical protein CH063_00347 [Colletotrichum higginsianum]